MWNVCMILSNGTSTWAQQSFLDRVCIQGGTHVSFFLHASVYGKGNCGRFWRKCLHVNPQYTLCSLKYEINCAVSCSRLRCCNSLQVNHHNQILSFKCAAIVHILYCCNYLSSSPIPLSGGSFWSPNWMVNAALLQLLCNCPFVKIFRQILCAFPFNVLYKLLYFFHSKQGPKLA